MARPNSPDMPPKRTKKVRLGINIIHLSSFRLDYLNWVSEIAMSLTLTAKVWEQFWWTYIPNRQLNRPFPNFLEPPCQSKARCTTFDMKMSFHSHANKTNFRMEGCAPSLPLTERLETVWKWLFNAMRAVLGPMFQTCIALCHIAKMQMWLKSFFVY